MNITEFRAIARRASSFEAGVQSLLDAGVKGRGRAINYMRMFAGEKYNAWMAKKHPGVQHLVRTSGAQTL